MHAGISYPLYFNAIQILAFSGDDVIVLVA